MAKLTVTPCASCPRSNRVPALRKVERTARKVHGLGLVGDVAQIRRPIELSATFLDADGPTECPSEGERIASHVHAGRRDAYDLEPSRTQFFGHGRCHRPVKVA